MKSPKHTPWGPAQDKLQVAEGITQYNTASHGGYELSADRHAAVQQRFPKFHTFAGGSWYEEDQDWSIVAMTFPEHFDDEALRVARRIGLSSAQWIKENAIRDRGWMSVVAWLVSDDQAAVDIRHRIDAFELSHRDCWEVRSMGSVGNAYRRNTWHVTLRRLRDGATQCRMLTSYPENKFWSDKELDAATYHPTRGADS